MSFLIPKSFYNLKLMSLLLALTTGVVGQYQDLCFSPMYLMKVIVAGHLLDGNVNRDIIKG